MFATSLSPNTLKGTPRDKIWSAATVTKTACCRKCVPSKTRQVHLYTFPSFQIGVTNACGHSCWESSRLCLASCARERLCVCFAGDTCKQLVCCLLRAEASSAPSCNCSAPANFPTPTPQLLYKRNSGRIRVLDIRLERAASCRSRKCPAVLLRTDLLALLLQELGTQLCGGLASMIFANSIDERRAAQTGDQIGCPVDLVRHSASPVIVKYITLATHFSIV